ncbi:hypothetical protein PG993_006964 [Apiospora rasikravindrae]|uniref:Uncharacterized protein n=1 Tax=Apiospora rasikravindrae TaxID=990691 RepID=A0ABR1SYC4_9PEZI
MASSEADIPWDLLIANFTYASIHPSAHSTAYLHQHKPDFFPCKRPGQGDDMDQFVNSLAAILTDSAARERKKYPEHHEAVADDDEIVVPDADAVVIAPHLGRCHSQFDCDKHPYRKSKSEPLLLGLCAHVDGTSGCRCALRFGERRMSTFLRPLEKVTGSSDLVERFRDAFLGLEMLKAILIYGDMNTVFRICAHPRVDFLSWWAVLRCSNYSSDGLGWESVCKYALHTYIGLNFIRRLSYPSVPGYGEDYPADFRLTTAYEDMVDFATTSFVFIHVEFAHVPLSHIPHYLHRRFFGISDDECYSRSHSPCWPIDSPYMPSAEEIEEVRSLLFQKGLPAELVHMVLEFTGYKETRALKVPHDPFHKRNRKQLDRYLGECWEILMRCGMMAKALGDETPWDVIIANCIADLLFKPTNRFKDRHDLHYKIYHGIGGPGLKGKECIKPVFYKESRKKG